MALRGVYKITGIVDDPANILKAIFRASKLEYWVPSQENANALRMVVDFGENIQIIAKNETGPQFFHRPEVVSSVVILKLCSQQCRVSHKTVYTWLFAVLR